MPTFSVSCSGEMYASLQNKAVSPSKAFQLGSRLILEHGVNGLEEIIQGNKVLKREVGELTEINIELKQRVVNLKEELEHCRSELLKDSKKKKPEKPKPEEKDVSSELISEIKEEESLIDKKIKERMKPPEE
ncbi:MAG: hypothetical protein JSW41_05455 [Candidatus Aenigmatarchaeota archaeon]|nr:MAG: hypothetical protein JSW41_05455 [Candidatus Aenigmarchaeota archaeon]